jgi:hypothetical protein
MAGQSDNKDMPDYLRDWYYQEPGWRGSTFVRGPFPVEYMRDLITNGEIDSTTQVRCGVRGHWHPLDEVSAIFAVQKPRFRPKGLKFRLSRNQKIALLVIMVVAALIGLGRREQRPTTIHTLSATQGVLQEPLTKEAVIGLTNDVRAKQGLANLTENPLLDAVAEERAKDLLEKQYFAHVSPTGEQASDVAQRVGYRYKIIAENLASGLFFTNQKVIDGWMQSPGP